MPQIEDLGPITHSTHGGGHSTKSHPTPGWSYVPVADASIGPAKSSLHPKGRKRGRDGVGIGPKADTTARQQAAVLKRLNELDRENHRDGVVIPVPVRARDGAGRASKGKVTPNVRKILTSQKTFANYLADEDALLVQNPPSSSAAQSSSSSSHSHSQHGPSTPNQMPPPSSRGSARTTSKSSATAANNNNNTVHAAAGAQSHHIKTEPSSQTQPQPQTHASPMVSVPTSTTTTPSPYPHPPHHHHHHHHPPGPSLPPPPSPNDPLLITPMPPLPSHALMASLLSQPPLSYKEARADVQPTSVGPSAGGARKFCEICGYWGRVKCLKCGARVCGLDCMKVHEEGRCLRFYA